jgi:hypothetical protein
VRRADNLAAICEPTASTMWDPEHLAGLQASTACYGDSFFAGKNLHLTCALFSGDRGERERERERLCWVP